MTEDRWEQQPGGLYLSLGTFDQTQEMQRRDAEEVMRATVQTVAQTHGAGFNEIGFRQNMQALYAGDIRVDFYLAKWDICSAQPICLGAAIGWPTVGFDRDGNIKRGLYTEDACLLANKLRPLIKAKPKGKDFPEESLMECYERMSLQNMRANGEMYKYGEVDPDNLRALRPQLNNGGYFGKAGDSAVLEFETIPSLFDRDLIELPIVHPRKNDFEDDDLFIIPWRGKESNIRFIVTKGQATAAGRARIDVRPWRNGALPDQDTMEMVVASALFAIKNEVQKQKWAYQPSNAFPSPSIPIGGDRSLAYMALYNACGNEIILPTSCRLTAFGPLAPAAHVFIINDRPMLKAFTAVGAAQRLFGGKPTMPGENRVAVGDLLTLSN